jgi:hypothetical protein
MLGPSEFSLLSSLLSFTLPEFTITCPYCGEDVEVFIEDDVRGSLVQDCEVCCNPWRLIVSGRGESRDVTVQRADGSE